jgi:hypothetical protein
MAVSPLLGLHIGAGTLGFLSGGVTMAMRKGSHRHALAGKVFVVSMLSLGATGVMLAIPKSQPDNVIAGTLTFYLVATAWITARGKDGETNIGDWGALLCSAALALAALGCGIGAAASPAKRMFGMSPGPYFFNGIVALLYVRSDARVVMRGGLSGSKRIARHLWRMCFAWFIAAGSIFLARAHLFPAALRRTGALYFLSFLPLILMIFWLLRVRSANGYKRLQKLNAPSAALN